MCGAACTVAISPSFALQAFRFRIEATFVDPFDSALFLPTWARRKVPKLARTAGVPGVITPPKVRMVLVALLQ